MIDPDTTVYVEKTDKNQVKYSNSFVIRPSNKNVIRRRSKGKWTPEEDAILSRAVIRHKGRGWRRIAEELPGRSDVQCLHRWQKVINPELVKGPWSKEEDERMIAIIKEEGAHNWSKIASRLGGRIGKQCRERWHNHLDPTINKGPWTPEEEAKIHKLHAEFGNKWAKIASQLPGRTDNMVKNHWNSSFRKAQNARNSKSKRTKKSTTKKSTTTSTTKRKRTKAQENAAPIRRRRGRPRGSKNKTKPKDSPTPLSPASGEKKGRKRARTGPPSLLSPMPSPKQQRTTNRSPSSGVIHNALSLVIQEAAASSEQSGQASTEFMRVSNGSILSDSFSGDDHAQFPEPPTSKHTQSRNDGYNRLQSGLSVDFEPLLSSLNQSWNQSISVSPSNTHAVLKGVLSPDRSLYARSALQFPPTPPSILVSPLKRTKLWPQRPTGSSLSAPQQSTVGQQRVCRTPLQQKKLSVLNTNGVRTPLQQKKLSALNANGGRTTPADKTTGGKPFTPSMFIATPNSVSKPGKKPTTTSDRLVVASPAAATRQRSPLATHMHSSSNNPTNSSEQEVLHQVANDYPAMMAASKRITTPIAARDRLAQRVASYEQRQVMSLYK